MYLCVKAKCAAERFSVVGRDCHILARTDLTDVGRKVNGEPLMSSKAECISIFPSFEAERDDSHPNQVATVDPLKALRNHCFHTLKKSTYLMQLFPK